MTTTVGMIDELKGLAWEILVNDVVFTVFRMCGANEPICVMVHGRNNCVSLEDLEEVVDAARTILTKEEESQDENSGN